MEDSVFTKIIRGEIPCHKVYEDDQTIAFLDIDPINPGHVLVVPKQQIEHFWDLDDGLYLQVLEVTKKVALRVREVLAPPRVATVVDGFGAPDHCHVHVFPTYEGIEHTMAEHTAKGSQQPDHAALADMAKKLEF